MAGFDLDITEWVPDMKSLTGGRRSINRDLLEGYSVGGIGGINHVRGTVTVSGQAQVMQNYMTFTKAAKGQAVRTMNHAAEEIFFLSMQEVPFDTGMLQESAFIRAVEGPGGVQEVEIGYDPNLAIGKDGESYAWRQHEDPDYEHPTAGTKWHYLSDPFAEVSARYPDQVKHDVSAVVEKTNFTTGAGVPMPVVEDDGGLDEFDEAEDSIDSFWASKRRK